MNTFTEAADTLTFLTGGNATLTVTSLKTGKHFTFKVQKPTVLTENGGKRRDHDAEVAFIKVLTGDPNEWQDWRFVGTLFLDDMSVRSKRGTEPLPSLRALGWAIDQLKSGSIHPDLQIQHAGRCCRCGKTLTHPDSIESGIGPECRKHFS
jgi:hypothetical protein